MSILNWLKSLFSPKPLVRDVSSLSGNDGDLELTKEVVRSSNEPLKPHHRRRALRDPRLLPKPPMSGWRFGKKVKYFQRDEADRLFSSTLRTCDRNLRDLATDEEQLQRYNLPIWNGEPELANALGLTVGSLRAFSIHRYRETVSNYVTFAIAKRSGGHRLIHAPKRKLKAVQRQLNRLLVQKLPVSEHAHGFFSKRSVATNARLHQGKAVVIKLDIEDCFGSLHFGRVRGLLVSLGYGYPVATVLAVLMTEPPRQRVSAEGKTYHVPTGPRYCVPGAPTSPGLCNALLLRMDRRLAGLARKHSFVYSRYADDLTFSGDDVSKIAMLIAVARRIVEEEGLSLNRKKTRVLRKAHRQLVTGVVVNEQAGLSRQHRRKLRAAIHQLSHVEKPDPQKLRQLAGKLAYLRMLNEDQAAPLIAAFQKLPRY